MNKLFILFLLLFTSLNATLTLQDATHKYENFAIQYLYDENSSLTIKEIQDINFKQNIPSQFTQGYKYANAWFKLEFYNNSSHEDFILSFTEATWSSLDLYSKLDGSWKVEKNGLNIPLQERNIQDTFPAFNIHIHSEVKAIYYVKGSTISSQIGEFKLYTKREFFNPSRMTLSEWYTIYTFVLFTFIILNMYNFIATKEAIYAYYIGYVFVFIIFSSMHSGIHIRFGFPHWKEGLHTLGQLTLFTLLLFSIEFLNLKITYPFMKKVFYFLAVISLFFALLLSQNIPYSSILSNIFFCGVLITIITISIKVIRAGFSGAKYYLVALMLYLPAMAIMAMDFNTILANNDFTRYSFLGGAFIEILLFTLILTNRYRTVCTEKTLAQNALLEEKHNNELLTKEATIDVLSNLYNRRYFFKVSQTHFEHAMHYKDELSVLMIDIDYFKRINDNCGHMFGDLVISSIANIFRKTVRKTDITARYGGEEFIILLPQADISIAQHLAEKIRVNVEKEDVWFDPCYDSKITVSIGISCIDFYKDKTIEHIIERSDKALYNAKESGRNKVCTL